MHPIALAGNDFDVILLVSAVDSIDPHQVIFHQLQTMSVVTDTQTFLVLRDVDARQG